MEPLLYIRTTALSTPSIIARNLGKFDVTGNVAHVANIVNQAITLQSNTHMGKIYPVAWVVGMKQQRPRSSILG